MRVETGSYVPAIEVEDLWFSYAGAKPTLRDITLKVEQGEVCMILGPSGSGKSTFLKVIKGLLKPERGRVSVLGLELSNGLSHSARRELGCRVAYIPQNLGLIRNLTVTENTLMGALGRVPTFRSIINLFPQHDRLEAVKLLDILGIAHKQSEKVYNLSGGERQRVAIARALMQKPRLILADEFVSQLDPITTREIMAIVDKIAANGVSFLVTTHEVDLVAEYGDRAFFFRAGEKVYECNAKEVDMKSVTLLMSK